MKHAKDIALELFELPQNGIDDVINLVFKYSGLGRLEYFDLMVNNAIANYNNAKAWRDDAGEIT